jgi:hypothetical protein
MACPSLFRLRRYHRYRRHRRLCCRAHRHLNGGIYIGDVPVSSQEIEDFPTIDKYFGMDGLI